MLELYHNDMSVCAQKVRIVLFEKKLNWESHLLNLRTGDQFNPDYLKLNSAAVVPTLVDDGNVVTESNAIIQYLDDHFQVPRFLPHGAEDRKTMHHWFEELDTRIHPVTGILSIGIAFRHEYFAEGPEAIQKVIESSPDEMKRQGKRALLEHGIEAPFFRKAVEGVDGFLAEMDQALADTGWLAGPSFSLADIALMPYLARFDFLGMASFWENRPHLAAWLQRLKERPSYQQVLVDDVVPTRMENLIKYGRENAQKLASMRPTPVPTKI